MFKTGLLLILHLFVEAPWCLLAENQNKHSSNILCWNIHPFLNGIETTKCFRKILIDGIDGALEKEEGLPTRSEFVSIILLTPKWHFTASQPLTLLFFGNQLCFSSPRSTYPSPRHDCVKFSYPCPDFLILLLVTVHLLLLVVIIFSLSRLIVLVVLS